jgi:hypothetical protein
VPLDEPPLLRENLADVLERLEFQGVTARIQEEHRGLFTGLPLKPDMRLDDELGARSTKPVGEGLPLLYGQNGPEVSNGDIITVYRAYRSVANFVRRKVGDDLMSIKIKIDPAVRTAPLGAAEQIPIEAARSGQIVNRKRQMEERL